MTKKREGEHEPEIMAREQHELAKGQARTAKWSLYLTASLALCTVICTTVGIWQAKIAQTAAAAAEKAADAAKTANDINADSVRARLQVKSVVIAQQVVEGGHLNITAHFDNIGKSPAFNVRSGMSMQWWNFLPDGPMPVGLPDAGQTVDVRETGDSGVTMTSVDTREVTLSLIANMPRVFAVHPSGRTLYAFGRVAYTTLNKVHTTEFCRFVGRTGDGTLMLRECPEWNAAD